MGTCEFHVKKSEGLDAEEPTDPYGAYRLYAYTPTPDLVLASSCSNRMRIGHGC